MKFDLGDKLKDTLTGFNGIAAVYLKYLYNQDRWGIVSQELKDGKPMEPYFLDENSLELMEKTDIKAPIFPELTVNLGDFARDSLTDFEGTVVGLGYWLNGCIRIGIQPKELSKDKVPVDETWFPMKQLVVLKKSKVEKQPKKKKPGGPMKDPTSIKSPR